MKIKERLIIMNFLQFAVWGAYLTSMGGYLASVGMGANIGWFYSVQGFVAIFMPAIIGIIADRWIQAQRLMSYCHILCAIGMIASAWCNFWRLVQSVISNQNPKAFLHAMWCTVKYRKDIYEGHLDYKKFME